jgi:choline dehydrogenase-like flavoprotein
MSVGQEGFLMSGRGFDLVIVGSGPVGSAVARTVADEAPELSVLLAEAGPVVSDPPGRHVKTLPDPAAIAHAQMLSQAGRLTAVPEQGRVVARPGTYLIGDGVLGPDGAGLPAAAMSTNVGGMGAHWTCACPVPGEGERIPWIPKAEFDAAFAAGRRMLGVTQSAFRDAPLGAEVRGVLSAAFDEGRQPDRRVQPMPLAVDVSVDGVRYWTGTDVILGDSIRGGVVELRAETLVTRIDLDGDRVTGVTVRDRHGHPQRIPARAVFVAADSFRTPRLLHVSGVRPSALGRYLNDHLQVMALARLDDRFVPAGARARRHGAEGTLDPFSGVNWIPYDAETFPFHGQIMQMDASPVPIPGVEEPWPGSIVGIGLFGCKEILAENRVTFDDGSPDESGLPGIRIHYRLSDRDRDTLEAMKQAARDIAATLGELVEAQPPTVLPNGSSLHYMGTVRMGPVDDGTSVCDGSGRVWGTAGLFVGGNGVIPTPNACNPTATSVALAIRSARQVIQDLGASATTTKENAVAS